MQLPQPQRREETDGVEVAGMIRHEHERAIAAHVLVPDNFKTAINAEQSANNQRDEGANAVDKHVGLPGKITEPVDDALVEIGGGFVLPAFASSSPQIARLWRTCVCRAKGKAFTTTVAIHVRGTLLKK